MAGQVWAQLVNNGTALHLTPGAAIHVNADVQNQNNGQLINNGTLTTTGSLLNNSGGILGGAGVFSVLQDVTNQATMSLGGATLIFTGTTNSQFTSGGGEVNILQLQKTAAGVQLMDEARVIAHLDFLANHNQLILGAHDLILATATIGGVDVDRYIVTNGSGKVQHEVSSSGFIFPVGASTTSYDPVSVTATTGTPTVGVRALEHTHLEGLTGAAINKNVLDVSWVVHNESNNDDLTVSMSWEAMDELLGFNAGHSAPMRYGNAGWVLTTIADYSSRMADITDQGGVFSVGGEQFAPMEDCAVAVVILEDMPTEDQLWQVADSITSTAIIDGVNDVSNDLDVTYKAGEVIILKPGFVVINNAEFLATIEECIVPQAAVSKPAWEDIPRVDPKGKATLHIFPNPFVSNTTIDYYLPEATNTRMDVVSARGELIGTLVPNIRQEEGYYRVQFQANNLAPGIYFVRLRTGESWLVDRMVYVRE